MDTKNVIAAISLSAAVIIIYSLFFQPDPATIKKNLAEQNKVEQTTDAPSLEQNENLVEVSREEALAESDRVQFENNSVIGSISLKGAAIDDLTFKDYRISLDSDERVKLLAPRNIQDGYLVESGFVTTDKNIQIPDSDSVWTLASGRKLTDQTPIKLQWTNPQGIIFEKEISLDDQFLFTINQKIINTTNKKYDFYSYGQIIRNKTPEIGSICSSQGRQHNSCGGRC